MFQTTNQFCFQLPQSYVLHKTSPSPGWKMKILPDSKKVAFLIDPRSHRTTNKKQGGEFKNKFAGNGKHCIKFHKSIL